MQSLMRMQAEDALSSLFRTRIVRLKSGSIFLHLNSGRTLSMEYASTARMAILDDTVDAGEPFFFSSIHESSSPTVVYMFWRAPRL